jgi:hypothetical protein
MLKRPNFCSEEEQEREKASISPSVQEGKAPEKERRASLSKFDISFHADQDWTAKVGVVLVRVVWTGLETRQTTSGLNTFRPSLLYIWGPGTRKPPSS